MSALDELHVQCERRGWRIRLTGSAHYADGTPGPDDLPAMLLDGIEVRGPRSTGRELLARVPLDGLADHFDFDTAAVQLAQALASQGLIQ